MAQYLIQEETLIAIGDAIRHNAPSKIGNATINPIKMPYGIDDVYLEGYENGNNDGYDCGWQDGYPEGYFDGHSAGYDEGHTDGWNEGFEEGVGQGGGELHHLLYEQIQCNEVITLGGGRYCYPTNLFGSSINHDMTFSDYVEYENSSASSNPITLSVDNYSMFHLYVYYRVRDSANDEQYITEVVVPPHWNNSVDVTSHISMGNPVLWKIETLGARFTINGL